jgi:hypothetical protein
VKIDKNKLNTLLRSGLNPEIKTRKQLAAQLGLDPTSLTRWFATRDRLGNPRYPVVPDRHVTKILALFKLSPQCLSLNEEQFRHHCFELSLQNKKGQSEVRQQNVALRKISIEEYSPSNSRAFPVLLFILFIISAITWYFISDKSSLFEQKKPTQLEYSLSKTKCWSGFSKSFGDFDKEDEADPCHYAKLFHQAINQLKVKNQSQTESEFIASQNYLSFLSKQLDQRRLNDKIILNVELGKSELRQLNYLNAQNHFIIARDLLVSSTNRDSKFLDKISMYIAKIESVIGEK